MRADYHIHSYYSDDSREPLENIIRRAIELNLDEICITDHVDYGIKYDYDEIKGLDLMKRIKFRARNVNYPLYFKEIDELKNKYKDEITIKKGLEFGVQIHTVDRFKTLFDKYDLDFVILSNHQVDNKEFWTNEFQKSKSVDEYFYEYYKAILDIIKVYKDYSVLGHLDMLQRYTSPRQPFEKNRDIITEILKQVINDGKGIEVNTSSFNYKLPDLMPERSILKLYYDLGGKIITIGSDSHKKELLYDHIDYVKEELKNIGFTEFCTFEKMKPVYHKL